MKGTTEIKLSQNKIYKFNSTIIPVIIDYGKSHFVHDNKKYGFVNMYKFSTIQDIFTIFATSIFQIINLNYIQIKYKRIYYSNVGSQSKYRKI